MNPRFILMTLSLLSGIATPLCWAENIGIIGGGYNGTACPAYAGLVSSEGVLTQLSGGDLPSTNGVIYNVAINNGGLGLIGGRNIGSSSAYAALVSPQGSVNQLSGDRLPTNGAILSVAINNAGSGLIGGQNVGSNSPYAALVSPQGSVNQLSGDRLPTNGVIYRVAINNAGSGLIGGQNSGSNSPYAALVSPQGSVSQLSGGDLPTQGTINRVAINNAGLGLIGGQNLGSDSAYAALVSPQGSVTQLSGGSLPTNGIIRSVAINNEGVGLIGGQNLGSGYAYAALVSPQGILTQLTGGNLSSLQGAIYSVNLLLDAFENNSQTLDLSHLGLTEVPEFLSKPLFEPIISSSLNLSHNNISLFGISGTRSSVDSSPLNTKSLDLSYNKLTGINGFILSNIKFLDVSHNTELKTNTHDYGYISRDYEHFNATGCPFYTPQIVDSHPHLKYLALETPSCSLNQLIDLCPKLEHLELGPCQLNILNTPRLNPQPNLKSLSLDFKAFPVFSTYRAFDLLFSQIPGLQKLAITNVSQLSLPSSITKLPLKELNLSGSKIENLEEFIGDMTHLETLRLSNCSLQEFPPSITHLAQLKTLNIANNEITNLPDSIDHLTHLKTLNASGNYIDTLPPSFKSLSELQFLDLSSNPIASKTPLDSPHYLKEHPFVQTQGETKTPPSETSTSYSLPPDQLLRTLPPQLIPTSHTLGSGIFKATEESSETQPSPETNPLITRLGQDLYSKLEALCFKKKQKLPQDDQSLTQLLTEIDQNSSAQIARLEKTKKQTPAIQATIAHEKKIKSQIAAFLKLS